jgi:ABC-2 type transport system ATP-binding protein
MDYGKILVNDTPVELKKIIPGATALEVRIRMPDAVLLAGVAPGSLTSALPDSSTENIQDSLRRIPGVTKVDEVSSESSSSEAEADTVLFRLYAENTAGLVTGVSQALAEAGAEVRDLHLKTPSLEDVFIYLTGRNLR